MTLSDAKKVLSGEYFIDEEDCPEITLWKNNDVRRQAGIPIQLSLRDTKWMIRQLALARIHKEAGDGKA